MSRLITDHLYDTGPKNTHGPCGAVVYFGTDNNEDAARCDRSEDDHLYSEYDPPNLPDRVPMEEQETFIASDVAAWVRDLEPTLFKYRMARGQLGRTGYPRRLRRYERELRALRKARFTYRVLTEDGHAIHEDELTVVGDGDELTITLTGIVKETDE